MVLILLPVIYKLGARRLELNLSRQSVGEWFSTIKQAPDICRKLGGSPSLLDSFPEQRKGGHWETYWRLRAQSEQAGNNGIGRNGAMAGGIGYYAYFAP